MGGAKNCPETPRQKMIGVMYLVLTAMLALNVSSSILEGFSMVDSSLHTSIESSLFRNKKAYEDFKELNSTNPEKYGQWLAKANEVKVKSDELYNYIENFKKEIVKMVDSDDANDSAYVKQIKDKANLDKPAEYAILKGNGKKLKDKIDGFSKYLIDLSAGDQVKANLFKSIFSTSAIKSPDGSKRPWEEAIFEDVPVAAVVTVLTKYQSDVRAAEAEMVQFLKGRSDASDLRVNKLQALVIPESKYVIKGDRFKAKIVLSAVDTTAKPTFSINGAGLPTSKDGIFGLYEVGCSSTGQKKFSGSISFKDNYGNTKTMPFSDEYMVGEPTATMSNEDLNVVYRGIDNKFSVSVPGIAAANIAVRVDGGSASQTAPGKFIIRAQRDGEIKINVFAKINNKEQQMGGANYRVKYLPDPKGFLIASDGRIIKGSPTISALKSSTLSAMYGPDELVKANFDVKSFIVIVKGLSPQTVNGNRIPANYVDKVMRGDMFIITNIKAVGPDQRVRDLPAMVFQL